MLSSVQFEEAEFQGEGGRLRAQWEAESRAGPGRGSREPRACSVKGFFPGLCSEYGEVASR